MRRGCRICHGGSLSRRPLEPCFGNQGLTVARLGAEGFYVNQPVRAAEEGEDVEAIEKKVRRNGVGVYKHAGNVYEGEWVDDKMSGHGACSSHPHLLCCRVARGNGADRLLCCAAGTFSFLGGSSYDGDWVDNKFEGQGKYTWEHGAYFIGAWANNRCVAGVQGYLAHTKQTPPRTLQ